MYQAVTMWRIVCDAEGCEASPSEDGEFYAWLQKDGANDDLSNAYDWWSATGDEERHLCPEHAPTCTAADCGQRLDSDEWGDFCEDHAPEVTSEKRG